MNKRRIFKFKSFTVSHERSALPVGMDGVLIGAWADVSKARTILDVGTGCGLIALMCAQRNPHATVTGIDIHTPSVEETTLNFAQSEWRERLHAVEAGFDRLLYDRQSLIPSGGVDLIISNPPFFKSGLHPNKENARLMARHTADLSPISLIAQGVELLSSSGSIALIAPAEQECELIECARGSNLYINRICRISNKESTPPKRVMLQVGKNDSSLEESVLAIRTETGDYTGEYKALTRDFYIIF